MKEFVEYIVKNLVDHPDKVVINEVGGTHTHRTKRRKVRYW